MTGCGNPMLKSETKPLYFGFYKFYKLTVIRGSVVQMFQACVKKYSKVIMSSK